MPKRSSEDLVKPSSIVEDVVTEGASKPKPPKNPAAVALGRLGGLKGGKARAATLSAKRRREIAQMAASSRWKKPEA